MSIMANIAEGFDCRGSVEFAHFLSYAKGSCSELRSDLFVALDCGYLSEAEFLELRLLSEDISRLIQNLIGALKRQKARPW